MCNHFIASIPDIDLLKDRADRPAMVNGSPTNYSSTITYHLRKMDYHGWFLFLSLFLLFISFSLSIYIFLIPLFNRTNQRSAVTNYKKITFLVYFFLSFFLISLPFFVIVNGSPANNSHAVTY